MQFPMMEISGMFQALKSQKKEVALQVMKEQGETIFTLCHLLCLKQDTNSETLFSLTMHRAFLAPETVKESLEIWLLAALHREWIVFSKKRRGLGSREINLLFDWSRSIGRQTEDCLEFLNPEQREIFLLRFLMEQPLDKIKKITGYNEKKILRLFSESISQVSSV